MKASMKMRKENVDLCADTEFNMDKDNALIFPAVAMRNCMLPKTCNAF